VNCIAGIPKPSRHFYCLKGPAQVNGISALINIETRIRNQSGNINHPGIGIDAVHDTYMAYLRGETALGPTA